MHDHSPPDSGAPSEPVLDTVIVGGGGAGLTAAQVLGRARRAVTVVDGGEPRNAPAAHLHGFLSRDGVEPAELLRIGRAEIAEYGVGVVSGRVEAVTPAAGGFTVTVGDTLLRARTVLIATGSRDVLPAGIEGLAQRWGRDVLHCPFCHGYEVRDAPLGVIAGEVPAMAVHQALLIPQWSANVTFFTRDLPISDEDRATVAARGVRIVDGPVAGLVVTGDHLRAVRMTDGAEYPREAVFIGPRFEPNDRLLTAAGAERGPTGLVPADPLGRTTVPGLFAAGNVVDPMAQVIVAAGQGSVAAAAISAYLLNLDVEAARAHAGMAAHT